MSEVIRKSITLLNTIIPNEEKEEWSTTELSRELDIPIQTVHRLLSSLSEYGFVFQNKETKKFRLGFTLMKLGLSIRDNLLVRNHALPIMEQLSKKTEECVYLTVPEGNEGVFIDCTNADLFLKVSEPIGMRAPLSICASNRVILAHMKNRTMRQITQELSAQGKIDDIEGLENNLKQIRKLGFGLSCGETAKDMICIASPIFSWEDTVIASISVKGHKSRISGPKLDKIITETMNAGEKISKELGWIKPV